MELKADRLTKQYGSKIAVDRMSFDLSKGVTGLLGANGEKKKKRRNNHHYLFFNSYGLFDRIPHITCLICDFFTGLEVFDLECNFSNTF